MATQHEIHPADASEPMLIENKQRFVLFPIKHPAVWEMYKKAEASFWTAEEIDLAVRTPAPAPPRPAPAPPLSARAVTFAKNARWARCPFFLSFGDRRPRLNFPPF